MTNPITLFQQKQWEELLACLISVEFSFFRLLKVTNKFASMKQKLRKKKLTPMAAMYQVRYPSVSGAGADWRNLELSPLPLSKALTFSSSGGIISHRSYATELLSMGRKHVYIQNILSNFHLWVSKWKSRILSSKLSTWLWFFEWMVNLKSCSSLIVNSSKFQYF